MRVVVNAAVSVDGKLSTREREQVAISDEADFRRVDELRAASDAVMVGVGTVLADDPSLTVDDGVADGSGQPVRVVADSALRTPPDAAVLDDSADTCLLASDAAAGSVDAMEARGATVIATGGERVDLADALDRLDARGIDRLMVEGGGELVASLFEADLVDELSVYVAPMIIGGRDAPTLADGEGFVTAFPRLALERVERVGEGVLLVYDSERA